MLLRDKQMQKRGILLPLSSLPSTGGIGTLGKEAFDFIDFLRETNQNSWQMLPLCSIGRGNSPYASISCFAGEILYIDLEDLVKRGLLNQKEIESTEFPKNVDYGLIRKFKLPLLKKAAERFDKETSEFKGFCTENQFWLESFALYMTEKYGDDISFYEITQFIFYSQYDALHRYANKNGIEIIGDIPFYVDIESADVKTNPKIFKLGKDLTPTLVAGVPPDIFSDTGQLWGNPIYNWDYLKTGNYYWWEKRLSHNAKLYDAVRIDHFRAFADYYCIPKGSADARHGFWQTGVGTDFWDKMRHISDNTQIIAEDLGGEESPLVINLLKKTGFPNMKVLQFAFNSDESNIFLPRNFGKNCVCYTGTHDNDTTLGWYKKLSHNELEMFNKTVPEKYASPVLNLISFALSSKADRVIIPFTDYLELDSDCRINIPGKPTGNWEWRFSKKDITPQLTETIKSI